MNTENEFQKAIADAKRNHENMRAYYTNMSGRGDLTLTHHVANAAVVMAYSAINSRIQDEENVSHIFNAVDSLPNELYTRITYAPTLMRNQCVAHYHYLHGMLSASKVAETRKLSEEMKTYSACWEDNYREAFMAPDAKRQVDVMTANWYEDTMGAITQQLLDSHQATLAAMRWPYNVDVLAFLLTTRDMAQAVLDFDAWVVKMFAEKGCIIRAMPTDIANAVVRYCNRMLAQAFGLKRYTPSRETQDINWQMMGAMQSFRAHEYMAEYWARSHRESHAKECPADRCRQCPRRRGCADYKQFLAQAKTWRPERA